MRDCFFPNVPKGAVVCLAFCEAKSPESVRHRVFFESSSAWQPVLMTEKQKHSKQTHEGEHADEMGAEQRPLGVPGHLGKAAVSPPPLKHGVRVQGRSGGRRQRVAWLLLS